MKNALRFTPQRALKKLVQHLHKQLSRRTNGQAQPEAFNLDAEIRTIERLEATHDVVLGKRIHEFRFQELDVRLDRDVLGLYRVTVNQGTERRYSFTIVCNPGDYDALRSGYEAITAFLDGDRHLADLPNTDWLKGHFYGP